MASNDLRGKNEYAYLLNEVNLIGVCEIIFLSKISHFGVKRVQTANKQTEIALIYIDETMVIKAVAMVLGLGGQDIL